MPVRRRSSEGFSLAARVGRVPRLQLRRSGPWIGYGGLACLLWLAVASVLFAPWWGVVLLVAIWVLALLLAVGWTRPHPAWVAFVPVLGLVASSAAIAGGVAWWDWG
jgi:hypothetical protein